MLTFVLAVQAAIAVPNAAQQNADQPACALAPVAVSFDVDPGIPLIPPFGWSPSAREQAVRVAGKVADPPAKPVDPEGKLPSAKPENRDPAQALPECRDEPPKRRKRKSDYPMA